MKCTAIVKAYAIGKGAITPFPCIKLDTIIVCSSLKLVYQEKQHVSYKLVMWKPFSSLRSHSKNATFVQSDWVNIFQLQGTSLICHLIYTRM